MKSTLIGFYREGSNIKSIYSANPTFFDTTLNDTIIPTIVPLSLLPTRSLWTYQSENINIPIDLQDIINSKNIFMTSSTESSPYYILMYVPEKTPTMSRGGVLLRKTTSSYEPVIVTKNGLPFIVDIKGSGSPIGGFPDAHFRVQAGSLTGFHLRVTGGLAASGAKKEYSNLINIEKTAKTLNVPQHIQALGVHYFKKKFHAKTESFAQLLRLSPSSIRFSFKQSPELDDLNSADESVGIEAAGIEATKLLSHTPPLLHRNCSWNNLVYVNQNNYALTDYEEADHAHVSHCNLELINAFYPLYFNNKYYQETYFDSYKKGLLQTPSKIKTLLEKENPTSISELNDVVMSSIIHPFIFKKRQTGKMDLGFVTDTLTYMNSFLPKSFYTMELTEWANTKLRSYLITKKNLLKYYDTIRTDYGFNELQLLWNQKHPNLSLQTEFEIQINTIEKQIRKLIAHSKFYTQKELGQYKAEFHMITLFYDVPQREDWFNQNIDSITSVLKGLDCFLATKTIHLPITFITDNIEERRKHLFDNIISFICPYIPSLMVHFYNEKKILTSVSQHTTSKTIDISLQQIRNRLKECAENPCSIHSKIQENNAYLYQLFVLDYMKI